MTPQEQQIKALTERLNALEGEVYRNNFSTSQDFQKYCRFNTRLKVPHYAATPTTCEVGELVEVSGELYVCSAADTWTVVGTQT